MAPCTFEGNADMYGLGIRLGYYLQWYGGVFASLLAQEEVKGARFALALFIAATFLALVIQTSQGGLQVAEIYIILLLTFGAYIFLVPLFVWRLVTGCRPLWDPSRYPLVDPGPTHSDLHTPLLLAVAGYELWFWFARVPTLNSLNCQQYGFLFTKIRLNNQAFQIVNIILYFLLAVVVLLFFALRVASVATDPEGRDERERARDWMRRQQRKYGRRWVSQRILRLQLLDFVNKLITATIVVIAVELSIKWNRITGTSTLSSAGQLIPFVIGLGIILRILYVWISDRFGPSRDDRYYKRSSQSPSPALPGPTSRLPIPMANMPAMQARAFVRD